VNNGAGQVPGFEWYSPIGLVYGGQTDHTNSLVPLSAKGDAGRVFKSYADLYDPVRGPYLDNTEIFNAIQWAMTP
jgi:alkaline phosphatase